MGNTFAVWTLPATVALVTSSSTCSQCALLLQMSRTAGLVPQHCLQCICELESECKPIGCRWDVNSNSCGYFQIKEAYYKDCYSPGSSWQACANDKHCASQCVQNYMRRYASHYGCHMTCEDFAREHNGGPRGCKSGATDVYWRHLKSKPGCSNL